MSLRTKNLEAIVREAKELAVAVLSNDDAKRAAGDLLSRILTHEAIHES